MQFSSFLTFITSSLLLTTTALAAPAPAAVSNPPQTNFIKKRVPQGGVNAFQEIYLCNCYSSARNDWNSVIAWYIGGDGWRPYRTPSSAKAVTTGGGVVTWENKVTYYYDNGDYLYMAALNGSWQKGVFAGNIVSSRRSFACYGDGNTQIFYDSRFDAWCGAVYKCI